MNATLPTSRLRGEIFYDAECGFCQRGATRWGGLFERRGFHWLPLQTPGSTGRLGASDAELRAAMKLRLADGRIVSGVAAWSVLLRAVWWLWPLGVFMELPGLRILSAVIYRWIARHRHGLGSTCHFPSAQPGRQRHRAFFELP